jgi:3-hydroxybutyryl-CoA dehydratase
MRPVHVGLKASDKIVITEKMVQQFGEMCGDFNPIHFDEEYAKTTRFGRRIAHGMILGALFSRALNDHIGEGGVYLSQTLKFTSPVFINDEIIIELEIKHLREDRGIASVETIARKVTGEICAKGDAMIMIATSPTK